jgi:hypothetical protein
MHREGMSAGLLYKPQERGEALRSSLRKGSGKTQCHSISQATKQDLQDLIFIVHNLQKYQQAMVFWARCHHLSQKSSHAGHHQLLFGPLPSRPSSHALSFITRPRRRGVIPASKGGAEDVDGSEHPVPPSGSGVTLLLTSAVAYAAMTAAGTWLGDATGARHLEKNITLFAQVSRLLPPFPV